MSATVTSAASTRRAPAARPTAPRQLCLTELKLSMRDKTSPIWALAFPMVLLIIFGSIPSFQKPNCGELSLRGVFPALARRVLVARSVVRT